MLLVIRQKQKKTIKDENFIFYKRGIDSKVLDSNLQMRLTQGVLKLSYPLNKLH